MTSLSVSKLKNSHSQTEWWLLVVDNFAGHKTEIQLSNIELIYFKPNLTSVLQPADLNVICTIKKRYKKWYFRYLNHSESQSKPFLDNDAVEEGSESDSSINQRISH